MHIHLHRHFNILDNKHATIVILVFSPLEFVGQQESLVGNRNFQPPLLCNLSLFTTGKNVFVSIYNLYIVL